jgi:transposase
MPRSKEEHPADGILTVNDAASLINVSLTTIRRWFDEGEFNGGFLIHNTQERRIPAPSLLSFLSRKNMPIPIRLSELVAVYYKHYQAPYQSEKVSSI